MPEPLHDQEQSFFSHLDELRRRLIRGIVACLVTFALLVWHANDLFQMLSAPLIALLPPGSHLIATDLTSPFMAPLRLSFMVALFVSMPYLLFELWGFIAPALYQHEKRIAIPLLTSSILLFYTGVAFAYRLILPTVLHFFTHIGPSQVAIMADMNHYLDFTLKFFLVFGLAFEIPVGTFLLIWSGLTTVESLTAKRRYVIVGNFFAAMFLAPPDAFSMLMLAIPMCLMFEAGLWAGRWVKRNEEKRLNELP